MTVNVPRSRLSHLVMIPPLLYFLVIMPIFSRFALYLKVDISPLLFVEL